MFNDSKIQNKVKNKENNYNLNETPLGKLYTVYHKYQQFLDLSQKQTRNKKKKSSFFLPFHGCKHYFRNGGKNKENKTSEISLYRRL